MYALFDFLEGLMWVIGWCVFWALTGALLLTLGIPIWVHMYGVIDAYWAQP